MKVIANGAFGFGLGLAAVAAVQSLAGKADVNYAPIFILLLISIAASLIELGDKS